MANTFSVVIVNWNGLEYLPRCLDCLHDQKRPADEIIVVDNGSSDGSVSYIKSAHPEVRLIELKKNTGFAAANNLAAGEATGEWLVLLNPDAFAEPDWLAAYEQAIEAHPEIASFTGLLLQDGAKEIVDGAGDVYHVSGLAWRRDHGRPRSPIHQQEQRVFSACGGSAVYRKDLYLSLGGLDEDFFCYMEDIDLGFRLQLIGCGCRYVPNAIAYHMGSASTGTRSDFSVYHGHRNLVWTYLKNMPGGFFWLFLPLHLAVNLAALLIYTFRGQAKVIFRAKRDALRGIPRALSQRKLIQRSRRVPLKTLGKALRLNYK